ncbi:MAG: hypothetical protein ACOH19_09865 [Rhodoglobus sp.]
MRQSALVESGNFTGLIDAAFAGVVAAENESDETFLATWRAMTIPVGAEAFLRQQHAVMHRSELRASLITIASPPTLEQPRFNGRLR